MDFDGTIVEHKFPEIGEEKEGAIFALSLLQKLGHKIIIWTCREGKYVDPMIQWLDDRHFRPDAVNENIQTDFKTSNKVYADLYLDDRSYPPFPGWVNFIKAHIYNGEK